MPLSVPLSMRVLELLNYDEDVSRAINNLRVTKKPTPSPGHGQVLVQIEAAPCNPSDIMFLQGLYGIKKRLPTVPGWEGAGTVVASGGGILSNWLKGKRVACGCQDDADGTWAEYFIASAKSCVPLRKKTSFEQGASLLVNPLTAWALIQIAKKERHRCIIQTAAASQLGRMMVRLAADAGLRVINIVRSQEEFDVLKSIGAEFVLNSETKYFEDQLREECHRLKATICFDAVAGSLTGTVINAMPERSTIIVYGVLSYSPSGGIDGRELIFGKKSIQGFWLTDWIRQVGFLNVFRALVIIQKKFADDAIAVKVRQELQLEEVPKGILEYLAQMTAGKILVVPRKKIF